MISEILKKYETDKHKDVKRAHCYGYAYDYLLEPYKDKEIDLVEIGIEYGESLKAWREFFPKANIMGIDIEDRVDNKINEVSYVISDVKEYRPDKEFDIVIDDGSHKISDVLYTVENFKLKPGGIMIIEDCQAPSHWYEKIQKHTNYTIEGIDLRKVNGQHDDYLIVLRRYGHN